MLQIDVGDKFAAQPDFVPVTVHPGDTITVLNVAGDTLNYLTNFDAGAAGTLTPTNSTSFTVGPVWVQSQGRTSVQITGGMYG